MIFPLRFSWEKQGLEQKLRQPGTWGCRKSPWTPFLDVDERRSFKIYMGRKMDCFWILEEWPCVTWTSFCSYIIIYPWDWIHDQTIHWFEWSFSFAIYLLLLKENKKTLRYKLFSKHSNYICFFFKKNIILYQKVSYQSLTLWDSHISRHINFYIQFFSKYIVIIFLSIFEVYYSTEIRVRELLIY